MTTHARADVGHLQVSIRVSQQHQPLPSPLLTLAQHRQERHSDLSKPTLAILCVGLLLVECTLARPQGSSPLLSSQPLHVATQSCACSAGLHFKASKSLSPTWSLLTIVSQMETLKVDKGVLAPARLLYFCEGTGVPSAARKAVPASQM